MPDDRMETTLTRRKALARLGLGAAIAYAAPALLPLNEAAMAKGFKPPKPKGAPPWAKPTKPTKPTKPSKGKKKKKKRKRKKKH